MADPFSPLRSVPKVPQNKGVIVRNFSMQVVVNCTCGNTDPIVVHMIPGAANLKGHCPSCQSDFSVAQFHYDVTDPSGQVRCGVAVHAPSIVKPVGPIS